LNWRLVLSDYTQGAVIWVFMSLLFIALSALWSAGAIDIITAIRRCILYWVSGFGVFYLYHFHRSLFTSVFIIASAVSALMTLLWLIDYYFLIDNSVSIRFMSSTMDYFDLYQGHGYGALYNPLLFSHLLVFYLVAALTFLSSGWVLSRIQCVLLAVSSIIFIVALLASQTRMALGLFTFICAYSVIWHYKLKGAIVVAVTLIVIVALVLTAGESLLERGMSYRWDIWKEMFIQVSERPYLGFGYGTDVVVSPKGINKTWYDSHNIYLAILYYSGYLGLSFVLVAFFLLYRESKYLSTSRYIFNLWLIVLVFGGFTDGDGLLSRPSVHWFNLVIPCLLMISIIRSEKLSSVSV
jgi:O-antigen ligase